MALWLILGGMTLGVVGLLLVPVLRARAEAAPAAHDVEVYRDQLKEVAADLERGLIGADEAAAARLEIERRLLKAAEAAAVPAPVRGRAGWATAIVLLVAVPAVALGIYTRIGRPDLPDAPLAERSAERAAANAEAEQVREMNRLAETLAAKLAGKPDDLRGWTLLARTYMEVGRYDDAVAAYDRAIALAPTDGDLAVSAAEATVYAARGDVGPAARARFEAALKLAPGHPAALYYLALGAYQAGDARAAYEAWLALAKAAPPGAPYLPQLQARIDQAAADLGIAPEQVATAPPQTPPGPSAGDVAAAEDMSPAEREAMVRGMVQRLADRLAQAPDDVEGWTRLARAYGVLGETAKAAEAWGKAAALAPDDAGIRAQWDAAKAAAGQ